MTCNQAANIANSIIPGVFFSFPRERDSLFLTFDDGPDPDSTPLLLEMLAKHNAKATFFCLGKKVEKHPQLYDSILAGGHSTGNHTWSHLNGWTTSASKYIDDIELAGAVIGSKLFRPPYGRITPRQYFRLRDRYKIIMWTRQFADYNRSFSPLKTNLRSFRRGSILVMHDSSRTISKTLPLLERLLGSNQGASGFAPLPMFRS